MCFLQFIDAEDYLSVGYSWKWRRQRSIFDATEELWFDRNTKTHTAHQVMETEAGSMLMSLRKRYFSEIEERGLVWRTISLPSLHRWRDKRFVGDIICFDQNISFWYDYLTTYYMLSNITGRRLPEFPDDRRTTHN